MDQLLLTIQRAIEKRNTEEALRENEERFRSLVESAPDGIVISDEIGIITMWNNSAQNMFGFSSGEIIGKPLTALMPEEYHRLHMENM
jgi:PAS domain S-box-containing protein